MAAPSPPFVPSRRGLPRLVAWAALLSAGIPSLAGTATGSVSSQTTVSSACNVSGSTLSFGGAINPIGAVPVDATSTLTIECTATTAFSVALNAGQNAGGAANFSTRQMKNGAYALGYQLYVDVNRTSIWGDGTAGSTVYSSTGTGGVLSVTIYGRLPSLTGTVPGTYLDTVTVTVTY
ncbi:Csu type fimbrial protein [Roseateles aquatilis]|uniref:Csu type fimbrial protein n=1 Tax=Roseateles aquatilis TaxID=431061 RepID=UPI001303EF68|nr:spore coat U domain-containing protein [Roseateles aquatilis]